MTWREDVEEESQEEEWDEERQRLPDESGGQGTCHPLYSLEVHGCHPWSFSLSTLSFSLCCMTLSISPNNRKTKTELSVKQSNYQDHVYTLLHSFIHEESDL